MRPDKMLYTCPNCDHDRFYILKKVAHISDTIKNQIYMQCLSCEAESVIEFEEHESDHEYMKYCLREEINDNKE
jgi:hypothetical protein